MATYDRCPTATKDLSWYSAPSPPFLQGILKGCYMYSGEQLNCSLSVLILVPREVRTVAGPSVLWVASGAPTWLKMAFTCDLVTASTKHQEIIHIVNKR